ncbi:MAG: VOC family protein [Gammaproteobacteria bacterium]|nr:VOC family protein [Gammaproteobacteria bacterium]
MQVLQLDHLVLTVKDIEMTKDFYRTILGMKSITFNQGRVALVLGDMKINLHQHGMEFEPKSCLPTPGSADLCFLTDTPLHEAMVHVRRFNIVIEEGPVERTGATGPICSFYIRDPDLNLLEISNRLEL